MSGQAAGSTPRVSVVMSVWNPELRWLETAVASVLGQRLADLELIVLEDPPHRAGTLAARFADARLRYVPAGRSSDLASSRAQTLALARAELVAVLDADDECHPDRLRRQVEFLDAHADVDLVGSSIEVVAADGARLGYRSYPAAHDDIVRAMRRRNPLAHPSVMFRKAAVLRAGNYRTRGACDDYDLWSRMAKAGCRFANLPEPLVRYRLHDAAMKRRQLRATLRDTLWIKRHYFGDELDAGDRLRMLGERLLLGLPGAFVAGMFRRTQLQTNPPGALRP